MSPHPVIPTLESYGSKYEHVAFERRAGILQVTLHSDGGPLRWGWKPHLELPYCFSDVAADRRNEVVILTGTGRAFCDEFDHGMDEAGMTPRRWDLVYRDAKQLIDALLDIEVPVIGVVNGPARYHAELALLSDIVIASEDAVFQDAPHFAAGVVPGDGAQVLWPLLLGLNRGRHFLLTGAEIDAARALDLGLVAEVMPHEKLLSRAWELATDIQRRPVLTRRYSRVLLTHELKRTMHDLVGYGVALEGLAALDYWPPGP